MTLTRSHLTTRTRVLIALVATAVALAATVLLQGASGASSVLGAPPVERITLSGLAASDPARKVEFIVQLKPGVDPAQGAALVRAAGGSVERDLPIFNGFSTTLPAGKAQGLSTNPAVHAVTMNAAVKTAGKGGSKLDAG